MPKLEETPFPAVASTQAEEPRAAQDPPVEVAL